MAKEKEKKEKYSIAEIATETEAVIYDEETEEQYTQLQAITKIMNDMQKLLKLLD